MLKEENTSKPLAWYFRTSVIVIALLSVGPLALPLIWFHPRYKRLTKVLTTALTIVLTYYSMVAVSGSFKLMMRLYHELTGASVAQAAQAAKDSSNTFEARPVEKQPASEAEPNYIIEGGKVIKNPKKSAAANDSSSGEPAPAETKKQIPAEEEPNFISVGGKVIPNPKKQNPNTVPADPGTAAVNPPAAVPGGEEPNFISVNGKVIPNPNKKRAA